MPEDIREIVSELKQLNAAIRIMQFALLRVESRLDEIAAASTKPDESDSSRLK